MPPAEVEVSGQKPMERKGTMSKLLTPKSRTRKVAAIPPSPKITAVIKCGQREVCAEISVDSSAQHTIKWTEPISLPVSVDGKPATLLPGSCNMYKYPKTFFDHLRKGKGVAPPTEQLYVLEELMSALLLDKDEVHGLAFRRDWAGATPMHGLLVANTTASLGLALSVYRQTPALLTQNHTGKIFGGENGLHILCVNSREAELCECVEIAAANLSTPELQALFWSQAEGVFFTEEPMSLYGSTPISYAVAFSLQAGISTMFRCSKEHAAMKGVLDVNDTRQACKLTGFLPIHVAVANSLTGMVNFLLDLPGLPIEFDDMRARQESLSTCGKLSAYSLLNPLQVACKLGDKKLVQYILRTQSKQQWVWGPVSEYHLNLYGIDSIGDTGNDVMELVTRLDATESTKEMLLDEFMDGLLHKLFTQKYHGVSRLWHYLMRVLDLIYMISLYATAVWAKEFPGELLYPTGSLAKMLPWITLISFALLLEEDLRSSLEWWASARGGPRDEESKQLLKEGGLQGRLSIALKDMRTLVGWMGSHGMWLRMFGYLCAIGAELWLLVWLRSPSLQWDASAITPGDRVDPLLILLSLACFVHTMAFFDSLLFESERIGILYKVVFQMAATDVTAWLILFGIFLINYGGAMSFVYPRFGYSEGDLTKNLTAVDWSTIPAAVNAGDLEPVEKFTHIKTAILSLVDLAFIGEPLEIEIEKVLIPQAGNYRSTAKTTLFFVFLLYYYIYVTMSLILLLNLLIAMMGDTYSSAMEHATLGWRVDFARRTLRLELQLSKFHKMGCISLNCGTKVGSGKDAQWVWSFKSYQANAEGGGTRGRRSMFDQGIEDEAEEDELDDDGPGAADGDVSRATPAMVRMNTMANVKVSKRAQLEQELEMRKSTNNAGGDSSRALEKMRVVGARVAMVTSLVPSKDTRSAGAVAAAEVVDDPDVEDVLE
jgi:hypothetical protein